MGMDNCTDKHLDLKPENLLYLTRDHDSDLVLADFGIAKTLDNKEEALHTMAGSFGYAAPEVMDRQGHGKPVDMWSLGVITYTLLCGYSPFRSENLRDLLDECLTGSVVFHERYWRGVSDDAKDFIRSLIVPEPERRATSKVRSPPPLDTTRHSQLTTPQQALQHEWLSGHNATEIDLLPEIKSAREARAKFKHAILAVSLKKRIAALKAEEDSDGEELGDVDDGASSASADKKPGKDGDVFRAIVRSAIEDKKAKEEAEKADQ